MSDAELIECLICGNLYRSLGHHVRFAHGISPDEYRDRHGIRRYQPLTARVTHERYKEAIGRQIDAGLLAATYAANATRVGPAEREKATEVRRALIAQGATFRPAQKPAAREVIETVIRAIEGGQARKAAIAMAPISESRFYVNLARYPDLKRRLTACFARRA